MAKLVPIEIKLADLEEVKAAIAALTAERDSARDELQALIERTGESLGKARQLSETATQATREIRAIIDPLEQACFRFDLHGRVTPWLDVLWARASLFDESRK